MALRVVLTDPKTGNVVGTGIDKSLAVGPSRSSIAYNATLGTDDAVVEIVPGKGGHYFYITGLILTGNRGISTVTDAVVNIFSATADDLTASLTTILDIPVAQSSQTVITSILLEVPIGHFIMGKTSDDDVLVTILGFYVEA